MKKRLGSDGALLGQVFQCPGGAGVTGWGDGARVEVG